MEKYKLMYFTLFSLCSVSFYGAFILKYYVASIQDEWVYESEAFV